MFFTWQLKKLPRKKQIFWRSSSYSTKTFLENWYIPFFLFPRIRVLKTDKPRENNPLLLVVRAKIEEIEGINTAKEVGILAKRNNVEMPISEQVINVINSQCSAKEAVQNLISRQQRLDV